MELRAAEGLCKYVWDKGDEWMGFNVDTSARTTSIWPGERCQIRDFLPFLRI